MTTKARPIHHRNIYKQGNRYEITKQINNNTHFLDLYKNNMFGGIRI